MKTKFPLLSMVLLLCCFYSHAAEVSLSDAQNVALNFYKANVNYSNPHVKLTTAINFIVRDADGVVDFYVFDMAPVPGFVIVSATDNVTPVLGYSTEANFNGNFPEIGIREWVHHASAQIHDAVVHRSPPSARTAELWSAYRQGERPGGLKNDTVAPMLSTQWNQDPYYNLYCPYDSTKRARCITGCAATSMAQIMKYWSYPVHGTGSFTYVDSVSKGFNFNIGTVSANFGATTYQWQDMPAQVTGDADDTAVAQLMYDCGVAAEMDYGVAGSAAYFNNMFSAFTTYFGYDRDSISYRQSMYLTSAAWLPVIIKDLNAGRPVLYTGQDSIDRAGHAWVCDGYDVNEMLHMNWGWGGMDNGYFLVTDLNASPYNFSWFQSAITGIQPPKKTPTAVYDPVAKTDFKLFPNPANRNFTIDGNAGGNAIEYTVYDVLGNRIGHGLFAGDSTHIEIGNWTNGVYLIKLEDGPQATTLRLVVEK